MDEYHSSMSTRMGKAAMGSGALRNHEIRYRKSRRHYHTRHE